MERSRVANQTEHNTSALDNSTRLAFERTWVAYERTMLAWVRTATSLITFGFSIYKFFQIIRSEAERSAHFIGARQFGILLVSIGLASLALATVEYRQNIRRLGAQYQGRPRSLAVIVAALISILGVLAMVLIVFHE
jgi:putative membrane protein